MGYNLPMDNKTESRQQSTERISMFLLGLGLLVFAWTYFEFRLWFIPEVAMFAWVKFAVAVVLGLLLMLSAFLPPDSESTWET